MAGQPAKFINGPTKGSKYQSRYLQDEENTRRTHAEVVDDDDDDVEDDQHVLIASSGEGQRVNRGQGGSACSGSDSDC